MTATLTTLVSFSGADAAHRVAGLITADSGATVPSTQQRAYGPAGGIPETAATSKEIGA